MRKRALAHGELIEESACSEGREGGRAMVTRSNRFGRENSKTCWIGSSNGFLRAIILRNLKSISKLLLMQVHDSWLKFPVALHVPDHVWFIYIYMGLVSGVHLGVYSIHNSSLWDICLR